MTAGPAPEELGQLPDELLDADSVALIYDEIEGLNFFRDFGRLDALFADPALARDRTNSRPAARVPGRRVGFAAGDPPPGAASPRGR